MSLQINKIQKQVLSALLDQYENSKTYKGEAVRSQNFFLKPEKVFPDYNGDYTDQDEVNQFNRDMQFLAGIKFVFLDFVKHTSVIARIILNKDTLSNIYKELEREEISKKRERQIELYEGFLGIHYIMDGFCRTQIERLKHYQNAKYEMDTAFHILQLLETILKNEKDIMERELSVAVLGDTKLFEKSYRGRVCKIIEDYGNFNLDFTEFEGSEKEKIILEEFQVLSNPSYIFFKGDVEIQYMDGSVVAVKQEHPVAISSEIVGQIAKVKVNTSKIVTVENLTSYNRMYGMESTYIYLSGYHNTAKQRFLKRVSEDNREVKWYHFGDIDPDGYYILKNLTARTKIPFEPLDMGIEQLKTFKMYCKKLEKNDIIKANSLLNIPFYEEVMRYMLENNCKLEQEIISWKKTEGKIYDIKKEII